MTNAPLSSLIFDLSGQFTPDSFRRLVKHCVDVGASDILIQSGDVVWAEIHGRQVAVTQYQLQHSVLEEVVPKIWSQEVLGMVKSGAGVDRALEVSGTDIGLGRTDRLRFRCNFTQAQIGYLQNGISITMRVIPNNVPSFESMGLEEDLRHNLFPSDGLILVCGPTGSGKTTLQASIYNYMCKTQPDKKIVTYEDPIEYILGDRESAGPKPSQSQIGRDVIDFPAAIRGAMRRKPSVIGIGEARDYETINTLLQAATTGHTCFSTLHTDSVSETINRMVSVFPAEAQKQKALMIAGCIRVVIVQRLLKTTDGKRTAVREYMTFDHNMRNLMQDHPFEQWSQLIRSLLEGKQHTMKDKAWTLLSDNVISDDTFIEIAGHKEWAARKQLCEELV